MMICFRFVFALLLGLAMAPALPVVALSEDATAAEDINLLGARELGQGWQVLGVPGKPETSFHMIGGQADERVLQIEAQDAVGFLYRQIDEAGAYLRWRWQVVNMGRPSDLTEVGRDDRPMAVHLWFPKESETSSIFGGVAELFGYPRVGRALTYVWGGAADMPRLTGNPYMEEGQGAIVALRRATDQPEGWFEEVVDYRADYEAAFGMSPTRPTHIAISGDSDDLGGFRSGRIADLRFSNSGN